MAEGHGKGGMDERFLSVPSLLSRAKRFLHAQCHLRMRDAFQVVRVSHVHAFFWLTTIFNASTSVKAPAIPVAQTRRQNVAGTNPTEESNWHHQASEGKQSVAGRSKRIQNKSKANAPPYSIQLPRQEK